MDIICSEKRVTDNISAPNGSYFVVILQQFFATRAILKIGKRKLSMLLALASAGRSSDLRALDIRYMTIRLHLHSTFIYDYN